MRFFKSALKYSAIGIFFGSCGLFAGVMITSNFISYLGIQRLESETDDEHRERACKHRINWEIHEYGKRFPEQGIGKENTLMHLREGLAIGNCYRDGLGVEQNYEKAFEWYEKAAIQGDLGAAFTLGLGYFYGNLIPQNLEKSFEWLSKASKSSWPGRANIWNNLGVSYATGAGTDKNYEKAMEYFQKSANQGWSEAKFNIGICYAMGFGVEKDLNTAKKWFEESTHRSVAKNAQPCKKVELRAKDFLENNSVFDEKIWVRNWNKIGF